MGKNIILASHFSLIQDRVDKVRVPAGIGRIPTKIQCGFAAFTADQFKNWVLYYSVLALRGILLNTDMECWKHFVLACRLLWSKYVTKQDIQLGSVLLLKFCQRCERQYGELVYSVTKLQRKRSALLAIMSTGALFRQCFIIHPVLYWEP